LKFTTSKPKSVSHLDPCTNCGERTSLVRRSPDEFQLLGRFHRKHLFDLGRERANEWLAANFERLGFETTVDLKFQIFLIAS
jgi:hypothetical protein